MSHEPQPGPLTADPGKGPILLTSGRLPQWLADQDCALALTTYQAGRLMFIGRRDDGSIRAHERIVEHCQGMWTDGQSLWVSGAHMLWRFENDRSGPRPETGVDRRFFPREGRVTGQIDIHDIGFGDIGDLISSTGAETGLGPIFVNTAFNCLATISQTASFRPLWRPPFISALIDEDRCHLNGLAMDGTRPAYVTAVSRSDVADGWRERRCDGGVVVDVASGEIVASGLSMPHSPRLHRGRLWVLDTGRGELCTVDPADGRLTPVAFLPGFARGLAFIGGYAVVGLSRPRGNKTFAGLPLEKVLARKDAEPRCGLVVIDIETGCTVEWLRFEHTIDELYDVAILPGARQPEAVGFLGDAIRTTITPETI